MQIICVEYQCIYIYVYMYIINNFNIRQIFCLSKIEVQQSKIARSLLFLPWAKIVRKWLYVHVRHLGGKPDFFQLPPLSVQGPLHCYLQSWPGIAVRLLYTHRLLRLTAWVHTLLWRVLRSSHGMNYACTMHTRSLTGKLFRPVFPGAWSAPAFVRRWQCYRFRVWQPSLPKWLTKHVFNMQLHFRFHSKERPKWPFILQFYSVLTSYDTIRDLIQTKKVFHWYSILH